MNTTSSPKPIRTVRFTRTVQAPRQLVWDVWTRAEHLQHWFSPNGFTVEGVESDPRPGGIFKLIMVPHDKTGLGGGGFWSVGKYLEVDPPRRLLTRVGGEGPDGSLMFEVINTAEFEEQGGKTIIHVTSDVIAVNDPEIGTAAMAGMEEGWKQTLDRFEARVARVAGEKK
jgi:uncharacterized protein YndB with AHSA1/START domain